MKKVLLVTTLLFSLFIIAIIIWADADRIPRLLEMLADYPGGDKVGHFILYGILSFLLNASAMVLFPRRQPVRLILTVSVLLSILIALEEWSQSIFPSRSMSLSDLLASIVGVLVFAWLAYRTRK